MGLRVGGLSTGLDTNALIDSLMEWERRPLVLVEQHKARIELQQSLFRDLNTKLLALRDAAASLDNRTSGLTGASFEEELLAYTASSTDESIVEATATGSASPGSFDVHVEQLATVGREFSVAFASSTDPVVDEGDTLSIDYGGASSIDITVGAGGASLQDLRSLINDDANNGGNVRAEVLFDGTDYRLVISGTLTGAANDLTVSYDDGPPGPPLTFLDTSLEQTAEDAVFDVLGLTITRESNEVTDALPGLTLRLRGAHTNPTDTLQVNVSRDDETIAEGFQAFVDAYNEVLDFLIGQSRYDEANETAGPLSGDSTLRTVERTVQRIVVDQYSFTGNPFTSLGEVGMQLDEDGRLVLDREALTEALDENPFAVRQLMGGDDVTDGIATALARALDPITESGTGMIAVREDGFDDRIASLERQIERLEIRLEKREELLVLQFSRLESTVAALQAQGNSLLSLIIPDTQQS
jgi:flagellar hook-associated protein 2